MILLIRLAFGALLIFAALPGTAATVAVTAQNASPGQTVISPVTFVSEGQQVAALQFDLDWDSALDVRPVAGDGLRQMAKTVYTSSPGPRTLRFVLIGMNQDSFADGEILKALVVVSASAAAGSAQIRVRNVEAADASGSPVAVRGEDANIVVQPGPAILSLALLNAASLTPGPISPGEIITLIGAITAANPTVWINGVNAPVLFAGAGQINAIVPFGLDLGGPAALEVRAGSTVLSKLTTTVAPAAPGVFTQSGAGSGPGAVLNQNSTLNTYDNPAARGSTIMIYGTGFGRLASTVRDGASIGEPIALQVTPVVTIGGIEAAVSYFGNAPGQIAGLSQINAVVPAQLAASLSTPVVVTSGGVTSPVGVNIAVK
jgi:uncharacterized protein (TIGR03437 family)